MENGLVCDDHWAEARREWAFFDWHPLTGLCALNDAGVIWANSWEHPPGYCAIPNGDGTSRIEVYEVLREQVEPASLGAKP